jgi:two-component system sensor histidine kinase KdpD
LNAAGIVAVITIAGFLLDLKIAPTNLAMLYLMGVAFISLKWGFGPALLSSLISTVAFDSLFIPPYRSFAITDVWYLVTLITLMGVALLISLLASAARRQTLAAKEREAHTASLYSLTRALSAARNAEEILQTAAGHVKAIFDCDVAIFAPDKAGRLTAEFEPSGCCLDTEVHATAARIFRQASGDASIGRQGAFLPLRTAAGALGVMVLLPAHTHPEIGGGYELVLEAAAGQVASAMERAMLEEQAREAEVLRKAD